MGDEEKVEKYDGVLMSILESEGDISTFLESVYSFLNRRTDFYAVRNSPTDKRGFYHGEAEKISVNAFRKCQKLANPDIKTKDEAKLKEGSASKPKTAEAKPEEPKDLQLVPSKENDPEPPEDIPPPKDEDENLTEEEKQLKKMQKKYQALPESYNGAVRENYCWSQSIKELDVTVMIPKYVTSAKQVKVEIERSHIFVAIKEPNGEIKTLVDGDLCFKILLEERSYWTLNKNTSILLTLEKVDERWWDALLTSEPKINIRNIDASRPMDELGEEEQSKIHEMMYNEQQKRLGKPTSEQMKLQGILREAWNKEGSPFKGQPFDPTAVNVSASGDMVFAQPKK